LLLHPVCFSDPATTQSCGAELLQVCDFVNSSINDFLFTNLKLHLG
jgi:hypothetical protein